MFRGQSFVVENPQIIDSSEFSSFKDLVRLQERGRLPKEGRIRVTQAAWCKFESLLFSEEELAKLMEK